MVPPGSFGIMIICSRQIDGVNYSIRYPYDTAQVTVMDGFSLTDKGFQAIADELELLTTGYQMVASF